MARFLLDANLSPRVTRYLTDRFALDIAWLQGKRLGELPDREVVRMAIREGRVIITLDRDFQGLYRQSYPRSAGIIHLDLPNRLRTNDGICAALGDFFTNHAGSLELTRTLVVIREDGIEVRNCEVE